MNNLARKCASYIAGFRYLFDIEFIYSRDARVSHRGVIFEKILFIKDYRCVKFESSDHIFLNAAIILLLLLIVIGRNIRDFP